MGLSKSIFSLFLAFTITHTAFAITGNTTGGKGTDSIKVPTNEYEFKIMTYNVLNLFDAKHDRTKLDHTFLPLNYPGKAINCQKLSSDYYREECLSINWTESKVKKKIRQIRKVVNMQGSLPDLLAVQEIENGKVAKLLADELGYDRFVITNSPDRRGIDVALLFNEDKLDYVDHEEYDVSQVTNKPTRNILRVHFRPKVGDYNNIIGVYVNHWPSQAAAPVVRMAVAKELKKIIDQQISIHGTDRYHTIATGDFNNTDEEAPNGFHHAITSPFWVNQLLDVQKLSNSVGNPMTWQMPFGTYYYHKKGIYNVFDRFFVSRNLYSPEGVTVDRKSFRIIGTTKNSVRVNHRNRSSDFYATSRLVPKAYDFHATTVSELGFSDHYPVVVKFKLQ